MKVHFIGAGPGAPDLLTIRAQRLIASSPVCLYAGALVPPEIVAHAPADARVVDTQHMELDAIVAEFARASERGEDVARLHSGDLSIYSALGEQTRRLDALGIDWEMTPGVPAFAATSAALRRELTLPGVAQSVILTRYRRQASKMPSGEELAGLAAHGATLVLHLGVQAMAELVAVVEPHYGPDCPVAVVARASWPDETILRGTLATIAPLVAEAGIKRTATIVIGPVLAGAGGESFLYSKGRSRPGSGAGAASSAADGGAASAGGAASPAGAGAGDSLPA